MMVLAGVLAVSMLPGMQARCIAGQNENCKDEGEPCVSRRVSECAISLVCPARIQQSSYCQDPLKIWPQCQNPPEHCKPNGAVCTPKPTSECKKGNHCNKESGTCQSGPAP
jgi:hypothetical protein